MSDRIPVMFTCPGFFMGKGCSAGVVNWVHATCSQKVWIDRSGDITCDGSCYIPSSSRFIQFWRFACGAHSGTYYSYRTVSDMLQAIANASYAITNYYSGNKKACHSFVKDLTKSITDRWDE